jgi:hypothetical protein
MRPVLANTVLAAAGAVLAAAAGIGFAYSRRQRSTARR